MIDQLVVGTTKYIQTESPGKEMINQNMKRKYCSPICILIDVASKRVILVETICDK